MDRDNDGERSDGLVMKGHLSFLTSSRHHRRRPTSFIKVFLIVSLVLIILCNFFPSVDCPKIKDRKQQEVQKDEGLESYGKGVSTDMKNKPSNCNAPPALRSSCISGTREYYKHILVYNRPSKQAMSRVTQRRRVFGPHPGKPS